MACYKAMRLVGLLVPAVLCATGAADAQSVREDFDVTNGSVTTTVVSGDTLYIAGQFTQVGPWTGGGASFDLPSLNLEPGFPKVAGIVYAVMGDGRGGWYIGGYFTSVGGQPRNGLAHIRPDKSVASWNPNVNGYVAALERRNNTIYVGGSFLEVGGQPRNYIAAVDAVTGLVTPWNPGADSYVFAMALRGTSLYVGGYFTNVGGAVRYGLAAVDIGTGMATGWNPYAVYPPVYALKVNGRSVYVGHFSYSDSFNLSGLVELDAVTGLAAPRSPNIIGTVYSIAISNGRLYAGGDFWGVGVARTGTFAFRRNFAEIDTTTGLATAWNPETDGPVFALAVRGYNLYVGGAFSQIAGQSREGLAMLRTNTRAVDAWNPKARDVQALAVSEEGVFAGGTFTSLGGQVRNGLAALDITSGAVSAWNPNPSGVVEIVNGPPVSISEIDAVAVDGSTVYVGGQFTSIGGESRNNVAALDAATGLATSWDSHLVRGPYDGNAVNVKALAVDSGIVYVGGCFTGIGGQVRLGLAAVEASTGLATNWDPITYSTQTGLCDGGSILTDGATVYTHPRYGYPSGYRLRAFDAVTGLQTPWNPDENNYVSSVALSGSVMYAGGRFTQIGGQPRDGLAALDVTAGLATGWDPGLNNHPHTDWIGALLVDGSKVYVGTEGIFGGPSFIEALDDASGSPLWRVDSTLFGRPGGGANGLAVSGTLLFAGGTFTEINGVLRPYLAAIELP